MVTHRWPVSVAAYVGTRHNSPIIWKKAEELPARPRRRVPGRGASPPGCPAEVMQMRVAAFPVEVTSGVPVVITPEEIDITNAGALRAALLRAGAQGRKTYVVDMTRTRFCDSAGLHALLGAHRRAQAEGGEVRFVVTGPGVRRVLAIMAVDRVIPVFGRLDEALAPPVGSGLSG